MSGFTAAEREVIVEAARIVASPRVRRLRAAHAAAAHGVVVVIAGRRIEYAPELPASGMTDSVHAGFF
ncbi:MAG: hypothetical protein IT379_35630, partial [Deltaproteobacteria bacterium]|nr:hypothetical protein [Deltaproteobacteria bacterium]